MNQYHHHHHHCQSVATTTTNTSAVIDALCSQRHGQASDDGDDLEEASVSTPSLGGQQDGEEEEQILMADVEKDEEEQPSSSFPMATTTSTIVHSSNHNNNHNHHRSTCTCWSPWFFVMATTFTVLVILLGISTVMVIRRNSSNQATMRPLDNNHNDSNKHDETPIPFESLEEYYEYVYDVIVTSIMKDKTGTTSSTSSTMVRYWWDPNRPQYDALKFLVYQDTTTNRYFLVEPMQIQQRLAVLLLYYATGGGNRLWTLPGDKSWIQAGIDECQWTYVKCKPLPGSDPTTTTTVIVGLKLSQLSLYSSSSLPVEPFAWLPYLETLDLSNNRLQGSLPSSLWQLKDIRRLSLHDNMFEGTLPLTAFVQYTRCKEVSLENNVFTGPLPLYLPGQGIHPKQNVDNNDDDLYRSTPSTTTITTTLQSFNLALNGFTGSIPNTWWWPTNNDTWNDDTTTTTTIAIDYSSMQRLFLGHNDLTGTLPTQLGMWTNLHILQVFYNSQVQGTIPTELGNLFRLNRLSLSNMNLQGTVPFQQLFSLSKLEWLVLNNNPKLRGSIPSQSLSILQVNGGSGNITSSQTTKARTTSLISLSLFNTALTGTLPSELGWLTSLQLVQLSNNQFSGTIPTRFLEYGWTQVQFLWLHHNSQLVGSMPCQRSSPSQNQNSDRFLQLYSNENDDNENNDDDDANQLWLVDDDEYVVVDEGDGSDDAAGVAILDFRSDCESNPQIKCPCCSQCF